MRLTSLLPLPGYIGAGVAVAGLSGWPCYLVVAVCCFWIDVTSAVDAKWSLIKELRSLIKELRRELKDNPVPEPEAGPVECAIRAQDKFWSHQRSKRPLLGPWMASFQQNNPPLETQEK